MTRIYSILFVVILFLPFLQHSCEIFPIVDLGGVEEQLAKTPWTAKGWLDGSFQQSLNERRDKRLGLRGYLVKTFNQIQYSVFGRIVSSSGTRVVLGKENWLFEKQYIDKINTPSWDDGYWMEIQAQSLQFMQEALAEEGIAFVFVLAPSKPEVYREYVPKRMINDPLPEGKKTDYEYLQVALKKYGVNFVDCQALFMEEKKKSAYQLFAPSGTHWNKYGAYFVWKNVAETINDKLRIPLQGLDLARVESRVSEPVEIDLALLLNLWRSPLKTPITQYPVFAPDSKPEREKPSLLVVGDSFLFTLVDIVRQANMATDVDAWYYFNTHFKYDVKDGQLLPLELAQSTPIDRNNVDWENQLFNKDLVVLVETKQWLPDIGFGFVQTAVEILKQKLAEEKKGKHGKTNAGG